MRLGFCSVVQSLVAMWTVAGANGVPGLSAHFLVEEESSSGNASVITRLLRLVGEAALELLNRRNPATFTSAQVVLSANPSLILSLLTQTYVSFAKILTSDFLHSLSKIYDIILVI